MKSSAIFTFKSVHYNIATFSTFCPNYSFYFIIIFQIIFTTTLRASLNACCNHKYNKFIKI